MWEIRLFVLFLGGCSLLIPQLEPPSSDPSAARRAPTRERAARLLTGDADHDHIADGADQCRCMLEDFDGHEDRDGCPDVDNDRDGIADACDACPDAPGSNAGCGGGGCPDRALLDERGRPVIPTEISFARDRAAIPTPSLSALRAVRSILIASPELTRVRVVGHADASEVDAEALSLQRADTVLRWLLATGIDPARLEVASAGAARPRVPAEPFASRWRNRRVAFDIVSHDEHRRAPQPPTCDPATEPSSACDGLPPPAPVDVCELTFERAAPR